MKPKEFKWIFSVTLVGIIKQDPAGRPSDSGAALELSGGNLCGTTASRDLSSGGQESGGQSTQGACIYTEQTWNTFRKNI